MALNKQCSFCELRCQDLQLLKNIVALIWANCVCSGVTNYVIRLTFVAAFWYYLLPISQFNGSVFILFDVL